MAVNNIGRVGRRRNLLEGDWKPKRIVILYNESVGATKGMAELSTNIASPGAGCASPAKTNMVVLDGLADREGNKKLGPNDVRCPWFSCSFRQESFRIRSFLHAIA